MNTISNIRRQIYQSKPDHIFTTREFLAFELRATVDQALYRLVKRGLLVRVARGVFVKEGSAIPSIEQVSRCKAKTFGKRIIRHCADIAKELKLIVQGNLEPTFAISGRTTSFRFGEIRIHLKGISLRKMRLGDSTAGQALRALWYLGQDACRLELIMNATHHFNRPDRQAIKSMVAFMPAWLTNNFSRRWC